VAGATAGEERPGEPNERDGRPAEEVARERLRALLRDGVRTGEAAARVAKEFHLPKRVAYRFALDIATEASE